MQYPFSCLPDALSAIEATLAPARLARYLPEAKGDKHLALRLYIWNARLCEAFYIPTQFAEVAVRNAVHKPVRSRFGEEWYQGTSFKSLLPKHHQEELAAVVEAEKRSRGGAFTGNHVIAGLSFGFWLNLLTSRYEKHLWQTGLQKSFPLIPSRTTRQYAYDRLNQLSLFRNKRSEEHTS